MAKITGILPPSAVFIFAPCRPPHISRPLNRGDVSFSARFLPLDAYIATMGKLGRGKEGRLKTPVPHHRVALLR